MNAAEIVIEFQRRRLAAMKTVASVRYFVAIGLIGLSTAFQQTLPWLPIVIFGLSCAAIFVAFTHAIYNYRCPACSRVALDPAWWKQDDNEFPTNPVICPHCKARLK